MLTIPSLAIYNIGEVRHDPPFDPGIEGKIVKSQGNSPPPGPR